MVPHLTVNACSEPFVSASFTTDLPSQKEFVLRPSSPSPTSKTKKGSVHDSIRGTSNNKTRLDQLAGMRNASYLRGG